MITVYRIAKTKHIRNLSGTGARIYGGRWNRKGIGILYTSESRALATVEYIVHVSLSIAPTDLSIASLEISGPIIPKVISTSELPANWYDYPGPSDLAELGTNWVLANDSLLLSVPSAVIKHEFNILINPSHPDMSHVTISHVEDFTFDERLLH